MKPFLSIEAIRALCSLYTDGPMASSLIPYGAKKELLKLDLIETRLEDPDKPWGKIIAALTEKGEDFVEN